ncbi:MAG: lipase [SAR202 cluster bacterium]|nr:lipase [SAR202 cluster bacterium]
MQTSLLSPSVEVLGAIEIVETESGWITFDRLPTWTKSQHANGDIGRWARMPSGVRIRFATYSETLQMRVHVYRLTIKGLSEEPGLAGFDLLIDGEEHSTAQTVSGGVVRLTMDGPKVTEEEYIRGDSEIISFSNLGKGLKQVEIWLPSSGIVEIESIQSENELLPPNSEIKKKWIHYGSSISHCIEAERPMNIWSVHASRLLDLSIQNFGLAGECHIDGFIARTIADIDSDFISLKLGINIVNADSMRERIFIPAVHNFLDIIRDKRPTTPIMVISPICCPFHEENPGPTLISTSGLYSLPRSHDLGHGSLNLPRIRKLLEELVSNRNDPNLYYMNGLELFSSSDVHMMPDQLHPNPDGYRLIGERFAAIQGPLIKKLLK